MTFKIQETESFHTIITHNKNVNHSNLGAVAKNIDKEISLVIQKEK